MPLSVSLTSLQTSDGTHIRVPHGGAVVIVGPNNSGKSRALRDLFASLTLQQEPPRVVTTLAADKQGDAGDLIEWLDRHCKRKEQGGQTIYYGVGAQVQALGVESWWANGPPFQQLGPVFILYASAGAGLGWAQGTNSFNALVEPPTHPLHYLYLDPALEAKLSTISREAFGVGLVLNRYAGYAIHLPVGEAPQPMPMHAPPPREHLEALTALPLLQDQGDGLKSFLGLLLNVVATDHFFVVIDEPEAFLHPPQARLLGRMLITEKTSGSQLIMATHDSNILQGILSADSAQITIIRLTREGELNRAAILEPDRVRELWSDPIHRYSNVLDGLFHRAVILCEGDADCRYYASVLDSLDETATQSTELLFTHCGGKHRMPTVVKALRAVRVPVCVVADFDILKDERPLRDIVQALNGDWTKIEKAWRPVKASLDADDRPLRRQYMRQEILKQSGI